MKNGDVVWVHPHGSPEQAVQATVDILSGNGRAIGLRLHGWPEWARVREGFLHKEDTRPELFLARFDVGPWIEAFNGGHYEIEETRPAAI